MTGVVPKIKVFSSVKAHVPNINTLSTTTPRKFIGRQFDPETKTFIVMDQPEEIEATNHIKQLVKHGDLIPADSASAKICGVKFNKRK